MLGFLSVIVLMNDLLHLFAVSGLHRVMTPLQVHTQPELTMLVRGLT